MIKKYITILLVGLIGLSPMLAQSASATPVAPWPDPDVISTLEGKVWRSGDISSDGHKWRVRGDEFDILEMSIIYKNVERNASKRPLYIQQPVNTMSISHYLLGYSLSPTLFIKVKHSTGQIVTFKYDIEGTGFYAWYNNLNWAPSNPEQAIPMKLELDFLSSMIPIPETTWARGGSRNGDTFYFRFDVRIRSNPNAPTMELHVLQINSTLPLLTIEVK